jgi:glutaredoxin
MIKEMTVIFLYAKDCPDCKEMKETLLQVIEDSCASKYCKIQSYDSESDEAIDIAIENDIDDLPGCVIGNYVFVKEYTYDSLLNAVEETWKNI